MYLGLVIVLDSEVVCVFVLLSGFDVFGMVVFGIEGGLFG